MNQPLIITVIFALAMLLLCIKNPQAGRIVCSFFFLAMAMVNIYLFSVDVQIYINYGQEAFWQPYRWFFREIMSLNPDLWVLLLVVYQLTISFLMMGNNYNTHLGLLGGIIFVVAIAPLSLETAGNLVMAAAMIRLMHRADYQPIFKTISRSHH